MINEGNRQSQAPESLLLLRKLSSRHEAVPAYRSFVAQYEKPSSV